jgi:hypothetical protein
MCTRSTALRTILCVEVPILSYEQVLEINVLGAHVSLEVLGFSKKQIAVAAAQLLATKNRESTDLSSICSSILALTNDGAQARAVVLDQWCLLVLHAHLASR